MNIELLEEIIEYIEYCELAIEGEWGDSRGLNELIEQNAMPDIYNKLLELKETIKASKK